ncbi:cell division protein FtsL [Perlucidibaca piscinae]|uniref:cell division protein FtsL n=1 Tax=Perlucidibaca piscinae TaxID=392589 RepID=UPI0003B6EBE1|nr:cell division protein FtsL [Perlucidibaca piscinae]
MNWQTRLRSLRYSLLQPGLLQTAAVILALVAASVAVAFSVHKSRLNLAQLQALQAERDQLEVEWGQLLLEQQAWGAYGRIGKVAVDEMGMRPPAPQEIMMVRP